VVILGDIVEYSQSIKISGKLLKPIDNMAKIGISQEEKKVLQGFFHNKAEIKTDYYGKKIAEMKQKYEMDFSAFQNKLYLGSGEIDLEEWNDFVLWRSYLKAYLYWAQFC
jgi:hypothetical protein